MTSATLCRGKSCRVGWTLAGEGWCDLPRIAVDVEDVGVARCFAFTRGRYLVSAGAIVCNGVEHFPLTAPLLRCSSEEAQLPATFKLHFSKSNDFSYVFHILFITRRDLPRYMDIDVCLSYALHSLSSMMMFV